MTEYPAKQQDVSVITLPEPKYPENPPYHPVSGYPEYPFNEDHISRQNPIYDGLRNLFLLLGYDKANFGLPGWNPLGRIIKPGMTVVIKPNFVISSHKDGKNIFSIITHPSVIRAAMDYVWIALDGKGKIIVADAPQYDCNWQHLLEKTGIDRVVHFYNSFTGPDVELVDLRHYWSRWKHFPSLLEPLPGDPNGNLVVNLGKKSALYGIPHPEKLYGAVYQRDETIRHHINDTQEYELGKTIMDADVVVSIPKLKVHKKVGVTLNIKGLVGISTNKNYLVHYSLSPPSEGGDQYPNGIFTPSEEFLIKTERWMYDHFLAPKKRSLEYLHRSIYWLHNHTTKKLGLKVAESKRQLDAGNWYGNDSAWRMAVDLYRVFLYSDKQGEIQEKPQRKTFSIIDGIIGGEGNGPLTPTPKSAGVLIAGEDFLAVDIVSSRLMGFDPMKIKMYHFLLDDPFFNFPVKNYDDISIKCTDPNLSESLQDKSNPFFGFQPHEGWQGHLEIT